MWQYSLLQILIALFPIGALQVWLVRSSRVHQVSVFMGIVCGLSMILCMLVSSRAGLGNPTPDLRLVPYLTGSLYGGIPGASLLTVLYMAARLHTEAGASSYIALGLFFVLFVPILFAKVPRFMEATRAGKLRIAAVLGAIVLAFHLAVLALHIKNAGFDAAVGWGLLFGGLFAFLLYLSIHYSEQVFDRLRLQVDYEEISARYHNEVRRLQQFIDFSPLVVIFMDRNGCVSHLNQLALKLLSPLERQHVLERPYRSVLRVLENEAIAEAVARVLKGEDHGADIVRIRNRIYYMSVCSWRVGPSARNEGAMLIAHDMTELQRLKDEVSKMERLSLVGQMAASITHEIRNPMAVIRGFVQLLNERAASDSQSYFPIILQELDRANAIINDFLSLAQNRIVEKNVGDLHGVLDDLMPLLSADANMRGQVIELSLCDRVDPLELNVKEIKQLILNLARNGMEAMDDKGVLRISTSNLDSAVELRVSDNGIGIPPEKLERLFEPFYTTKANGTGLGLALCLSIVERHNGKILVESKSGEGTTFIVSFLKSTVGEAAAGLA